RMRTIPRRREQVADELGHAVGALEVDRLRRGARGRCGGGRKARQREREDAEGASGHSALLAHAERNGDAATGRAAPSPLAGEGGEIERLVRRSSKSVGGSEIEPGEGVCRLTKTPLTRLAAFAARHPLPQGERVHRSTRGEGAERASGTDEK